MPRQLSAANEALVGRLVAMGRYRDAEQVLDVALRLLDEREQRLQWLRAELQPALEQEAHGALVDIDAAYREEIQQRTLDAMREGKPIRGAIKP